MRCQKDNEPGWKWGRGGTCFTGPDGKEKALKQAAAILASQEANKSDVMEVSELKKVDEELQIVWGEVYVPGFPDSDGDFMTAEGVRDMAYAFMAKGGVNKVDVQHDGKESGSYIVESFVAREGDPDFIAGAWVAAVKVEDQDLWDKIKKGELNGFSIGGRGFKKPTTIEVELPEVLKGETDEVAGHSHDFQVRFSDSGEFLGGSTGPGPDGHTHQIVHGTFTKEAQGHKHRFSFVEGILNAKGPD